jgi:hypothetical protein
LETFFFEHNSSISAMIVGVEALSGQLSLIPVYDKTAESWEKAITKMIERHYGELHTIVSDRETALRSKKFRRGILKAYGISWLFLLSRSKSFHCERMIRYCKERISMAMKAHPGEKNWTKFVDGVVSDYNRQYIKGTKIVRSSVNKHNYISLLEQLYKTKSPTMLFNIASSSNFTPRTTKMLWKFKIGDRVLAERKQNYKEKTHAFLKTSVHGAYSPITRVIEGLFLKSNGVLFLTPVYKLENIKGYFYENSLILDRSKKNASATDKEFNEEG